MKRSVSAGLVAWAIGAVLSAAWAAEPATMPATTTAPAGHVIRDIEYARPDGQALLLDAAVPDSPGPHPVVILVHGGGWMTGDKSSDFNALWRQLTDGGFTWFSIDYRMAPAHRWPACYDDLKSAIRWVKAHAAEYKGDPKRVALLGYSAGGQLVCLTGETEDPELKVQAVVGLAPPTDFEQDLEARHGLSKSLQALLDRPQEVTPEALKALREMGAINHVHAGMPPYFLMQGSADKTVPSVQSVNFQAKLRASGVPCELVLIDGAQHRIRDWGKFDPGWTRKVIDWLKEQLR